jgi:NADH-quinone oxidoreductase subunit F
MSLHEYEVVQAAVDEAEAADCSTTSAWSSTAAPARTSAARRRPFDSSRGAGAARPRPPFPPVQGLYDAPTQVNNVCTIATLPIVLELGAAKFAKTGAPTAPGTAIFSISGNVVSPGNYELELGTPMRELIYDHAGGIPDGRKLKCVIPGGSSVPALSPDQIDVPLDYDSLAELKTFFGAASLIVVDDRCCMVQLALRSTQFYMHESCGKCTPCREG